MNPALPLITIALAIAGLLLLVLRFRLPAFLALLVVSMLAGLVLGMDGAALLDSMREGMGGTLGFVAVVVGLGAMLGALLELSGGVDALARGLLDRVPKGGTQSVLGILGTIIAVPVFFDVAFIILVPVLYGLARKSGQALGPLAIALLCGLAVGHTMLPPTPGPVAVASLIDADLGLVLLAGLACGIPAMFAGAVVLPRYVKMHAREPMSPYVNESAVAPKASARLAFFVVTMPLLLMLTAALAALALPEQSTLLSAAQFVGHPFTALIFSVLLAYVAYGPLSGVPSSKLRDALTSALEPAGVVILVTGAGGVFKQVLVDSGAGASFAETLSGTGLPLVGFAFAVAAIVRVSQGSATVAMITAGGLAAPLVDITQPDAWQTALVAASIACGATLASHVNDSGFWLVNRYLGQTEMETLRSWTLASTVVGLTGFAMVAILSALS